MVWQVRYPDGTSAAAVGNLVFTPGCTGEAAARVEDQVRGALDEARRTLEAAGSSMDNVVKTFFLITDLADYPAIRKSETEYYEANAPLLVARPPAATLMVVPGLGAPGLKARYETIAAVERDADDWAVTYYPEFWGGKELAFPHVPREHAKFARTQVVGNLVIVSGCQALDHDSVRVETDDFTAQTRIVLEKIRVGMDETGGGVGTLVKTNVFLKDAAQIAAYRAEERAFFAEHAPAFAEYPPASTVYVMDELPRPEFLIEVEAFGTAGAQPGWDTAYFPGTADAAAAAAAGSLLFLSACHGTDADDALDALRKSLTVAGSSMESVVRATVLVKHGEDAAKARAAIEAALARPLPLNILEVPALEDAGATIALDVIAVR